MSITPTARAEVPLAVWTTSAIDLPSRPCVVPAGGAAAGWRSPALARRVILEYSRPRDLVVDPACGLGSTVAEAATHGRRAIGVEADARVARLAGAGLDQALWAHQRRRAEIRHGPPRRLGAVLADVAGRVDLVVGAPGAASHRVTTRRPRARPVAPGAAERFRTWAGLLRPGGLVVTLTANAHRRGRLVERASATVAAAQSVGLAYLQHVVVVLAPVTGDEFGVPAARGRVEGPSRPPVHAVVHADLLVFARPARG